MATIALKIAQNTIKESEIYEFQIASHLTKYRVPMYWIGADLAEALGKTTPPGAIDWYNMHMPFEAAVFMMPKGSLVHQTDGDCSFICYARLQADAQYFAPLIPHKPYGSINGGMVIGAYVEEGFFLHWNVPLNFYGPKITMAQLHELMSQFSVYEHPTAIPLRDGSNKMTSADHALGADVAHYLFSILTLMTARPELVTEGKLVNKTLAKKGREAKEFWSPYVIGERYKLRREPVPYQGGTHASPRFHWVEGFWKQQPYGPGKQLRREIWIEPYTRGLEL